MSLKVSDVFKLRSIKIETDDLYGSSLFTNNAKPGDRICRIAAYCTHPLTYRANMFSVDEELERKQIDSYLMTDSTNGDYEWLVLSSMLCHHFDFELPPSALFIVKHSYQTIEFFIIPKPSPVKPPGTPILNHALPGTPFDIVVTPTTEELIKP